MGIVKNPKTAQKKVDDFIASAPDGAKANEQIQDAEEKGSVQITLRITKDQLERINKISKRQGITRAAYMKRAVFIQLESDEKT